ncbi:uncharacterized protein A4U43_UnF9720 [Asparagus officinalis]|uniref:DUF7036 domain-containing protein n=1 Tax=Asparagus officinalis TaxID=4686 RepID=A0A1R3L5M3_ASPOF|nr:uncharacterized protein A4U43_UnF9720 [Asparagus officinalis]
MGKFENTSPAAAAAAASAEPRPVISSGGSCPAAPLLQPESRARRRRTCRSSAAEPRSARRFPLQVYPEVRCPYIRLPGQAPPPNPRRCGPSARVSPRPPRWARSTRLAARRPSAAPCHRCSVRPLCRAPPPPPHAATAAVAGHQHAHPLSPPRPAATASPPPHRSRAPPPPLARRAVAAKLVATACCAGQFDAVWPSTVRTPPPAHKLRVVVRPQRQLASGHRVGSRAPSASAAQPRSPLARRRPPLARQPAAACRQPRRRQPFAAAAARSRSGWSSPTSPVGRAADIKAGFILEQPFPLLVSNIGRLEYDILGEIGVPNTKVSIISMRPSDSTNWTYVDFAVLPNPKTASISLPALSVLRSSLVELVLQQLNLSLTPSIFGQPSSFEVMKFPGGITVIPAQSASIWEIMQILFNFSLNNSIVEIQKDLEELKYQLKVGLNLRAYENVYVQITNVNGSTVAPPVIVQASVLSDFGSRSLLPDRLKQLAQVIQGPHAENLGLNHSVFGKVKEVVLSSYLEHSIESPTPSPSPSLSPSPSPSPSPSKGNPYSAPSSYPTIPYSPVPSVGHTQPPCLYCTFAPRNPPPYAPEPESGPEPPQSSSPRSSTALSPQHEPPIPTSPMALEAYGPSSPKNRRSAKYPTTPILASSNISPSSISGAGSFFVEKRLIGLLMSFLILPLLLSS